MKQLKYIYSLSYLDFLLMAVTDDLYELESKLFLQVNPIEIELNFESLVLALNSMKFELETPNLNKFSSNYYSDTEYLVSNILNKGGKEGFKLKAYKDKEYIRGLFLSYFEVLEEIKNIQLKLMSHMRSEYIPITITVFSYIIQRMVTTYTCQYTQEPLSLSEMQKTHKVIVPEVQIKDLYLNLVCPIGEADTDIDQSLMRTRFKYKTVLQKYKSVDKSAYVTQYNKAYINDTLKILDLYLDILEQDAATLIDNWVNGGGCTINLPYMRHSSRNLTPDWDCSKCKGNLLNIS